VKTKTAKAPTCTVTFLPMPFPRNTSLTRNFPATPEQFLFRNMNTPLPLRHMATNVKYCNKKAGLHEQNEVRTQYPSGYKSQPPFHPVERLKPMDYSLFWESPKYQTEYPLPFRDERTAIFCDPSNPREHKRTMGMFAYYARRLPKFSDRSYALSKATSFPLEKKLMHSKI